MLAGLDLLNRVLLAQVTEPAAAGVPDNLGHVASLLSYYSRCHYHRGMRRYCQGVQRECLGQSWLDSPTTWAEDIAVAKNQAPHHAPDEPKAQALALALEGYSGPEISERVGEPLRTVQHWIARWRQVARNQETPELIDDWVRITRRAQGKMHDFLDYVEDHPDEVAKHAMTFNVYAGTGTDKLQRESSPTSISVDKVLIVYNAKDPTIELA